MFPNENRSQRAENGVSKRNNLEKRVAKNHPEWQSECR